MKVLITGVTGFVGNFLADYLIEKGIEVWGTTRSDKKYIDTINGRKVRLIRNDLKSIDRINKVLSEINPDRVFHLSGQSNVRKSWSNVQETLLNNVNDTINLFDACKDYQEGYPNFKLLTIGSSEEYGIPLNPNKPLSENTLLNPYNPYGTAKAAVSYLASQYQREYGLNVIHARPFNHIGVGQRKGFVVSDFIDQILKFENNFIDKIKIGNLNISRDFTDVRDIVRGYDFIINQGVTGEVYNVCSQNTISIEEILNILISFSPKKVALEQDFNLFRKIDNPKIIGCNHKITQLGWKPYYTIEETLYEIYSSMKKK